MSVLCGKTGDDNALYEEDPEENEILYDSTIDIGNRPFHWSAILLQSLREELEKCVVPSP